MNELQKAILDVCKRLDEICKKYEIPYFIMGGTALGAIRHGGFIPWDDDIDVFMTPDSFEKFRTAVEMEGDENYHVDTVGLSDVYVEYAKFKKKNTTFIEKAYLDKNISHEIFVDIMLLRKLPNKKFTQNVIYKMSQMVSFLTISETGWTPQKPFHKFAKKLAKILPRKKIAKFLLKKLSKYENLTDFDNYCYFMSRVSKKQGIFKKEIFEQEYIPFEDTVLSAPKGIKEYLEIRYGDYMSLPPENKRVGEHAFFYDANNSFEKYITDFQAKYAVLSFRRNQTEEVQTVFETNGIEFQTDKVYPGGGSPTHIDDISYPLNAIYIRGNADIGEVVKVLTKLKIGEVCIFDIDETINKNSAEKLSKIIKKHAITTINIENLKKNLHGKL